MQAPTPIAVVVPVDSGSSAWAPPAPPCGSFDLTVVEGRDLAAMDIGDLTSTFVSGAGKSDPFVTVTLTDQTTGRDISVSSNAVNNTLNPVWRRRCHSWVLKLPFTVKISVFDEDLVTKNDFMGYYEFTVATEDDMDVDTWVDLGPRPGKKDKKVKGLIHLKWSVKFMKNFIFNPATEWPASSLISIEPVPYQNHIDIMGPMYDLALLICLGDCKIRRLPTKIFFGRYQDEFIGWEIKVCTQGPSTFDRSYEGKWKAD